MADIYGIAQFAIGGRNYAVSGTFEVSPAYFRREVIMPLNSTTPCFQEVSVPATITGTLLKPKDVNVGDILSMTGTTITLKNGSSGKTFTLTTASQTGDGKYDPYAGTLPIVFTGEELKEV